MTQTTLESTRIEPAAREESPPPVFADILCGVDGSRGGHLAAQQAVALSGRGGRVRFVAVHFTEGIGLNEVSTLSRERAADALDRAESLAEARGVHASCGLVSSPSPHSVLRDEAKGHDLLVIGSHGGTRAGGIMLGGLVTQMAHRCERPLLIARRVVDHGEFPESVLFATDGSPDSWAAARVVARLAALRDTEVHLVHVPDGGGEKAAGQAHEQLLLITGSSGRPCGLYDRPGEVPERICQAARASQASLVVLGRRGLGGVRALGSVSERVAHRTSCSVLLVPGEATAP